MSSKPSKPTQTVFQRETEADPVVIVSAVRTPMGAFQGALSAQTAPQLGGIALQDALARSGVPAADVGEVLMGCVLTAGLGQSPARQAALLAGLPDSVGCTTITKACGSAMKAVMLAVDDLLLGRHAVMMAGGMESMTHAPYLLPKARGGQRLGHGQMLDHMFLDGLEDAYSVQDRGRLMGTFAEDCATHFGFTRQEQDDWARRSGERGRLATQSGWFAPELVPVTSGSGARARTLDHDETVAQIDLDKIPRLKPVFREGGTVTAANSSCISDGAAALVLMRDSEARRRGLSPLARVLGQATHARAPGWFTTAPVGAMQALLAQVGWGVADVDAWEINEAFAVVTLAAVRELGLDEDRVNRHGGACALGHPIGASGARILVTLLGALRQHGGRRGVASLCIGGGEATAMAVELY
ncbi:acetyl-CoA C-acyltransferase [Amphibiibacter pelophylacis]|uniref:Acetyl-CoA C-acyltransferase n=1 Tax=Amphibiibacter pelophylacis TaxID=1799477 RepID=A0ACC6P0S1_9BURK